MNNYRKKGVVMAPVSVGTTASAGIRDYTHTYSGDILTAVRKLTKGMVAKPVPCDPRMRVLRGDKRRYAGRTEANRRRL